jgi:FtsZ-binding cell division protein ZapB
MLSYYRERGIIMEAEIVVGSNSIDVVLKYLEDLKEERKELLRMLERRKRQKKLINDEIKRLNGELKRVEENIKYWRNQLRGLVGR